MNRLYRNDLR